MAGNNAGTLIEEKFSKKLKEHPEVAKAIGVAVAIELTGTGGGRWVIDCESKAPCIKADAVSRAVTTISMSTEVFEKMSKGELDPQTAFLTGKVKVDGNLGVAIKLGELLS